MRLILVPPIQMIDLWINRLYGIILPSREPLGYQNWLN